MPKLWEDEPFLISIKNYMFKPAETQKLIHLNQQELYI